MKHIRKATKQDIPQILQLIKELAIYEKAEHEVVNTQERMLEDGFGENPIFGCFVAEIEQKIIGIALYYTRYSTWKGKRLFLEDLIVTENFRGKGIGKDLLDTILIFAKENNFLGVNWQVLDWNQPAIAFYEKYNVHFDKEWWNVSLDFTKN